MAPEDTMEIRKYNLYNKKLMSDVTVKFSGQDIFAHKAVLANECAFFYAAFTGSFPVATSPEIDLGDDDDPDAVRAMIRHMYNLPYNECGILILDHLLFHMNVFIVADKYDIPSLREKIVPDFVLDLELLWQTEAFIECVQKLCGPQAVHLADPALHIAIADFFTRDPSKLMHHDSLVKMINEDTSLTGRVLAGLLKTASSKDRCLVIKP